MRKLVALGCVALALGCGKKDEAPAADTMAVAPAPMLNLSDLAGTWDMKTMPEGSDSVLVSYTVTATGTTEGWTINLPNRPPIPMRVSVSGDSLMLDAGPYESVLRKGVQVTTTTVSRLTGGKLMGRAVAHYSVGPDSVVNLRTEGTKRP
jgi:hypothetical protein